MSAIAGGGKGWRGLFQKEKKIAYLFFADSAVLVPTITEQAGIGARVAAQTGLAGSIQQGKDNEGGDPSDDAEAASHDAVHVSRAKRAAEGALEGEGEDGDRGEEVGRGDGEEDDGGREIGVCRPGHGQLAVAQVEVAIATVYFERVREHADDSAAEDNDEQTQAGAQPAQPVGTRADGALHAGALALCKAAEPQAAVVGGSGGEGGADELRELRGRGWGGRGRTGRRRTEM